MNTSDASLVRARTVEPLGDADARVLRRLVEQERRHAALHELVLERFGDLPILASIRSLEAAKLDSLRALCARFGIEFRPSRFARARFSRLRDVRRACEMLVDAEVEHAGTYARLRTMASDNAVLAELRNFERASSDAHLPALRALARELVRRKRSQAGRRGQGGSRRDSDRARARPVTRS